MDAHRCRNGFIRKYPNLLCSSCRSDIHGTFDIDVSEAWIDAENEKWKVEEETKQGRFEF